MMALAIPVAVAAGALIPLWPILDRVAAAFFAELTTVQQGSVLALIFAVIFASVATAQSLQSTESSMVLARTLTTTARTAGRPNYPLAEVEAVTSDLDKFKCLFPMLKDEILVHLQTEHELCDEAVDWVDRMVEYSVPGGKLNRGTTVLAVVRTLLGGRELTAVETCRAAILGWTIEFLQAFFLVADDVMDDSQTRRGQPCWYKLPKVGLIAINDAFLLESFVFTILRNHFASEPFYPAVLELLIDVTQRTEVGQLLDLTSQEMGGTMDLDRFTEERYKSIVKYKTAFYSFYLPVAMGMHMVMNGNLAADSPALEQARSICCAMGEYFQIQDDYLDCFGDPETIGKIGTDIQDKKCSWLAVQALKRCRGPEDRRLLEENYGVWDDVKVARVKQLFRDLGLVQAFEAYEEESHRQISAEIAQVKLVPKEVYELFLHKIYKRSK
jgi:farnesyl diphosphate synthase